MIRQMSFDEWQTENLRFCRYCKHFGISRFGRFICCKSSDVCSLQSVSCDGFVLRRRWWVVDEHFPP